jgi:hypothetical protein
MKKIAEAGSLIPFSFHSTAAVFAQQSDSEVAYLPMKNHAIPSVASAYDPSSLPLAVSRKTVDERRIELLATVVRRIVESSEDMPVEFASVVDEEFWNLL